MRTINIAVLLLAIALPSAASTVANNDSCDIGTYPAATLLLPYFSVDTSAVRRETTVFSVTNVSPNPQIAQVTIWTDWAFPVISFPLFLSGYDVQPINLYDIIVRGIIAPPNGTSNEAPNARDGNGRPTNPNTGMQPMTNLSNPKFFASASGECAPGRLPGQMPSSLTNDLRSLLTRGVSTGSAITCPAPNGQQAQLGSNHGDTATGYVTIDLLGTCSPLLPIDPNYWSLILFDNVLTGDYWQVATDTATGNYAGGNPLVHIRATQAPVPFTFYDRYTKVDRRQPLPSTFAARWISGSNAVFDTKFKVWREGVTKSGAACDAYRQNGALVFDEIVAFDEHENAGVSVSQVIIDPPLPPTLPATSQVPFANHFIVPTVPGSPDNGGWMYFNLNNGDPRGVSQNWVTVSLFAEGRFGVEYDATSLGNGCSPAAPLTSSAHDENSTIGRIGPRP